ncbi:hypothetical protein M0802_012134 [Mischocyttarus mexicanus]|nr:hypothetical protein M0802_012134 [Mischocyttarus mexicanus]
MGRTSLANHDLFAKSFSTKITMEKYLEEKSGYKHSKLVNSSRRFVMYAKNISTKENISEKLKNRHDLQTGNAFARISNVSDLVTVNTKYNKYCFSHVVEPAAVLRDPVNSIAADAATFIAVYFMKNKKQTCQFYMIQILDKLETDGLQRDKVLSNLYPEFYKKNLVSPFTYLSALANISIVWYPTGATYLSFIEQVLMRSMIMTGGPTRGRGITDTGLTKWVLTMIVCMQTFYHVNIVSYEQHVDSRSFRIDCDTADHEKLQDFFNNFDLFLCIDKVVSILIGVVERGENVENIFYCYVDFVKRHYTAGRLIVFDGYSKNLTTSTKYDERKRR